MKKILSYLLFLFFLNTYAYSSEIIYFKTIQGDSLKIVLPKGFCDFTTHISGKAALKHLKQTLYNQPVEPKIVYKPCNSEELGYPWGYLALLKERLPISMTQNQLSQFTIEGFKNQGLANSVVDGINNNHKMFNKKIRIDDLGNFEILWNDQNALIFFTKAEANLEGKKIFEVITGSIFLHKKYVYYNYIFENKKKFNSLKIAQKLLVSAKSTKGK